MSREFNHKGYQEALKIYNLRGPTSFQLDERTHNELFTMYMTIALQNDFQIGHINAGFKKLIKKPYSKFGYSRNDLTIMSQHYQKKGWIGYRKCTTVIKFELPNVNECTNVSWSNRIQAEIF